MLDFSKLIRWLSRTEKPATDTEIAAKERRQFQRIDLGDCHAFINEEGPFSIENLSFSGLRLNLKNWSGIDSLQKSDLLSCRLQLSEVQIIIELQTKNIFLPFVGFSFHQTNTAEAAIISDFLKPRIIGFSMREIDGAKLRSEHPDLKMRWFQGDDGTQIFLWQTKDGENKIQEFYFLDYVVSWNINETGIKTGAIKKEKRGGYGRISHDSVVFFKVPSYRALKLGRVILESANLPAETVDNLVKEILEEEKRLYHRYIIKDGNIVFSLHDKPEMKISVVNLSTTGMALLADEHFNPSPGTEINGTLQLMSERVNLNIKIIYQRNNIIGAAIDDTSSNTTRNLEKFLVPRLLAQYLENVPPPAEKPAYAPASARSYLFTGLHNTHILALIDSANGELICGRIAFMDRAISARRSKVSELHCPEGLIFPGDWDTDTNAIKAAENVSPEVIRLCLEILAAASIPDELLKAWQQVLKE